MKRTTFFVLILFVLIVSSCRKTVGEGPVRTETRAVTAFSSIEASIPGEVRFTQAPALRLQLEAQQNILDVLETYVAGDRLVIRVRGNRNIHTREPLRVLVEGPSLQAFRLSGSGNAYLEGTIDVPGNFIARVSGSGSLRINSLQAPRIDASVSGSGNLTIAGGSVTDAQYHVSGSGGLDAAQLEAAHADAATSGSGSIRLFATQTLKASVSGSGGIGYRGSPQVDAHVSGSGRVTRL